VVEAHVAAQELGDSVTDGGVGIGVLVGAELAAAVEWEFMLGVEEFEWADRGAAVVEGGDDRVLVGVRHAARCARCRDRARGEAVALITTYQSA